MAKLAVPALMFLSGLVVSTGVQAQGKIPDAFKTAAAEGEAQDKSVGSIRSIQGVVSLQTAQGRNKFAADGTKLNVGDVITTEKGSTAVLEFVDTTQVALRPSTRFVVEDYVYKPEEPIADKAQFNLVKGGLRTLTGLIGKRGVSDAFALKSETATIGIRGTDFSARICKEDDCERLARGDTDSVTATNTSNAGVAGRVSQALGTLKARSDKGERELQRGAPVFPGDVIITSEDGFAVLTMADATRLTIPAGGEMSIDAYRYAPASPKTSVASFKLLKGAVRFVTGAIGQAEPENVKFSTQTATIGIRGTAGDISCVPVATPAGGQTISCSGGNVQINVDMRSGSVYITTPLGTLTVSKGQSGFFVPGVALPKISNVPLNTLQNKQNAGPLPEKQPSNFEDLSVSKSNQLASKKGEPQSKKGDENNLPPKGDGQKAPQPAAKQKKGSDLFVSVNDGQVVVTNQGRPALTISRGQGGYVFTAPDVPPVLLQAPPDLLARDNKLSQPNFAPQQCTPL